jgi:hypothetical protein
MTKRSYTMTTRILAFLIAACMAVAISACGGSGKTYDIGPIFPLDPGKCAKYNGEAEGSGVTESCMVSKGECERAAADWEEAMQSSAVTEAIEFSCE